MSDGRRGPDPRDLGGKDAIRHENGALPKCDADSQTRRLQQSLSYGEIPNISRRLDR